LPASVCQHANLVKQISANQISSANLIALHVDVLARLEAMTLTSAHKKVPSEWPAKPEGNARPNIGQMISGHTQPFRAATWKKSSPAAD
jgi:hypothetical protein